MTAAARPVVGACHCCQEPVRAGEERRVPVEQATAASADVLLHRKLCTPVNEQIGARSTQ
jgi:hypothetical protein